METNIEVFLDVLILENFIVNFFLLYITSQTIRIKTKVKNQMAAALFGAMYVIVMVYPELKYLTYFLEIKHLRQGFRKYLAFL